MDDELVVRRLVQVAGELRECWGQALGLRVDRGVWAELGPALNTGDHEHALHAIYGWYVHSVLIRCRRLLDGREDSEGLVAALSRYATIAPHVTVGRLCVAWEELGTTLDRPLLEREVEETLLRLEALGHDVLDADQVRVDVERLREDHRRLARYASQWVAHLDRSRHRLEPITGDEVDAVIGDVLSVVRAYAPAIVGVDLSEVAYPAYVAPTVRALETFDWRAYSLSIAEETRRRFEGTNWPSNAREQIETTVEVRYVWSDPG